MAFEPYVKFDEEIGQGDEIKGAISVPEGVSVQGFITRFKQLIAWGRSPLQVKLDFDQGVAVADVKVRADQPNPKERQYSIGVDITDLSYEDRCAIFNMAQDPTKKLSIKIIQEERRRLKLASESTDAPGQLEQATPAETDPVQTEITQLPLSFTLAGLSLPVFPPDSDLDRLQTALLMKDSREESAARWKARIEAGLSDKDLKHAIAAQFEDLAYVVESDRRHFVVAGSNKPRIWIATRPEVRVNVVNKPSYEGAALLAAARKVLGIPELTKGKGKAKN